ncbi:hypothetical protein D9615_003854 [Tricholomella constricta]|uniref:Fungal-type protein kinase domain-containing protein n=1 Tax=Tricholomella constricta TaxID=117010 RepID=A0A8H5HIG6_9AGAR|nr:hypothetical protein D9615_003854 [Tricholomella constricta]
MTVERVHLLRVDLLESNSAMDNAENKWITQASGKLWEVGSIEAFQDVFVDCLEGHYHAFANSKVLHRVLSANNLRFRCTDNTSGKAKGILTDWDMASDVKANDDILPSTATHRTGTIPFMAIDLLIVNKRPPPHLFRHDLESFFYILVWAAFYYDFDKKERRETKPLPQLEEEWNNADLKGCANSKKGFLTDPDARNELFALVPLEGQSLLPWMNSVWLLFWKARYSRGTHVLMTPEAGWDDKTSGGVLTFENFMEALGRKPRL